MRPFKYLPFKYLGAFLTFVALPLWAQVDSSGAQPAATLPAWEQVDSSVEAPTGDAAPMINPAPISDEGYSLAFASETLRTNYLRGGFN
jgi:hypothetical protein